MKLKAEPKCAAFFIKKNSQITLLQNLFFSAATNLFTHFLIYAVLFQIF